MKVKRKKGPGDKRLKFLLKGLKSTKSERVGWFKSAKYDDKNNTPVAYVATVHEFGEPSKNIPPRPTMRPAVAKNRKKWREFVKFKVKKLLTGEETIDGILEDLGLMAVGDVKEEILALVSPPIKESTKRARARHYADKKTAVSDKPLVGIHKLLLNSVTNILIERGTK